MSNVPDEKVSEEIRSAIKIDGDAVRGHLDVLVDLFAIRGVPSLIRRDNGPDFIARRVGQFLDSIEVGTSYIEPGSSWQNGYVEISNSRFRDESLNCDQFTTVQEARVIIERWRQSYNHRRPQSSLDGLAPAAQRRGTNYPTHSFISMCQIMGALQSLSIWTRPHHSTPLHAQFKW
ncbi:MAG: integrase core domain-containing protein [Planctomycetota bacterium]|nr:integrase core domain-containing protein [Planctomycetota bacterium]